MKLKGFHFPTVFMDERIMIVMVVMVQRMGYDQTVEALFEMQQGPVGREEDPVTYDIQMEDIRVEGENSEDRFKNTYLSHIQYYLNQIWIKIVGIPEYVNLEKYLINTEVHGGNEERTIKQLIMEESTYIKENGTEYRNQV